MFLADKFASQGALGQKGDTMQIFQKNGTQRCLCKISQYSLHLMVLKNVCMLKVFFRQILGLGKHGTTFGEVSVECGDFGLHWFMIFLGKPRWSEFALPKHVVTWGGKWYSERANLVLYELYMDHYGSMLCNCGSKKNSKRWQTSLQQAAKRTKEWNAARSKSTSAFHIPCLNFIGTWSLCAFSVFLEGAQS